jgi:hypothetical protein
MNRTTVILLISALALAIVSLIVIDFLGGRPDKRPDNPYELNLDEFHSVPKDLVTYMETLNLELNDTEKRGIAFAANTIWLIADNYLQAITTDGREQMKSDLPESPRCITSNGSVIYIGFRNRIRVYDNAGVELGVWDSLDRNTLLTSLAVRDSFLFAADAGGRRVLRYKTDGTLLGDFTGKRDANDLHGFILPSPCFDLDITPDGELWVVNPGKHAFENYSYSGKLRGYWEKTPAGIEGFSGCCGPAHMTAMPDGSFATSEKGIVRIKIHKPSGEFETVVAPPESFTGGTVAPDIAAGPGREIYALDFERKMIRIFKPKI